MIKKIKGKYVVLSENTGRRFGTYDNLEEAKKAFAPDLPAGRQVEFFKSRNYPRKK